MRFPLLSSLAGLVGVALFVPGLTAQTEPKPVLPLPASSPSPPPTPAPSSAPPEPAPADEVTPAAPPPTPDPFKPSADLEPKPEAEPGPEVSKEPEVKRIALPLVPLEKQESVPTYFSEETDSLGYRWDVRGVGGLNEGHGGVFSGALELEINSAGFTPSEAFQDAFNRHTRVVGDAADVQVTRDAVIDVERAGASFLDTFSNPGDKDQELSIRYSSRFGDSMRDGYFTDAGDRFEGNFGTRDCGVLFFSRPSRGNRPSVMFLIADPKGAVRPEAVNARTSGFTTEWKLKLKPGESKSLLHVLLQRQLRSADSMMEQMKPSFRRRHLVKATVSHEMMPYVQNFSLKPPDPDAGDPDRLIAANHLCDLLDVDRRESDMLWMGKESMLSGEISGESLHVARSGGGILEVPLSDVAVMRGGGGRGLQHKLYLRDGTVLVADVSSAPMKLKSPEGWSLDVSIEQVEYLVFHSDKADGKLPENGTHFILLHSGEIAVAEADDTVLKVISPWGDVQLPARQIRMMRYLKDPTPRYRLELVDGSEFSAFVVNDALVLKTARQGLWTRHAGEIAACWKLDLLPEFDEDVEEIESLDARSGKFALLKGSNVLVGEIASEVLHLVAGTSGTPLDPGEIRAIRRLEESYDEPLAIFNIELVGGDSLKGYFKERFVEFRTTEGRVWTLPTDQLVGVKNEDPADSARKEAEGSSKAESEAESAKASADSPSRTEVKLPAP